MKRIAASLLLLLTLWSAASCVLSEDEFYVETAGGDAEEGVSVPLTGREEGGSAPLPEETYLTGIGTTDPAAVGTTDPVTVGATDPVTAGTTPPAAGPEASAPPQSAPGRETISLLFLTDRVGRGDKACLRIGGLPHTEYTIRVFYSSTVSTAKGLESKISDENGRVEWEWRIGTRTKPGQHRIEIEGGGDRLTIPFTTTE